MQPSVPRCKEWYTTLQSRAHTRWMPLCCEICVLAPVRPTDAIFTTLLPGFRIYKRFSTVRDGQPNCPIFCNQRIDYHDFRPRCDCCDDSRETEKRRSSFKLHELRQSTRQIKGVIFLKWYWAIRSTSILRCRIEESKSQGWIWYCVKWI